MNSQRVTFSSTREILVRLEFIMKSFDARRVMTSGKFRKYSIQSVSGKQFANWSGAEFAREKVIANGNRSDA